MKTVLHPYVKVLSRSKVAVDLINGHVHELNSTEQVAVGRLAEGSRSLSSQDFPLMEKGVIVLEEISEEIKGRIKERIIEYLSATGALCVMPTEKCNFRCTYCYETFEKGKMSEATADAICRFLESEVPRFKNYNLGWFGGEPLLHPQIIRKIASVYRRAQLEHGVDGILSITTNGFLMKPAVLELLEQARVDLFYVTLDGPPEIHNLQRPLRNGGSTYDVICSNVETALKTTSSRIVLRINVDTEKKDNTERLLRWIDSEIYPRFKGFSERIDYRIVSVWEANTTAVDGICIKDIERFKIWAAVKGKIATKMHRSLFELVLRDVTRIGGLSCYAGKPNHYIVGSDGRLYRCSVAFDLPENQLGWIRQDGTFDIDEEKDKLWTTASSLNDPQCSQCAFNISCQGLHCPLIRLQSGKTPCPTEKIFFDEIAANHARHDIL